MTSTPPSTVTESRPIKHFVISNEKGREKIDATRARELLPVPVNQPHNEADDLTQHKYDDYTHVTLSGKSFSVDAAKVFARFLASLKESLTDADLSDIIAGQMTADAVSVLNEICPALCEHDLEALDLSHNAIGARGVDAVATVLQTQTSLKSVKFNNDGLQGQTVKVIVEALLAAFAESKDGQTTQKHTQIRHIEFSRNLLQDDGPQALVPLIQYSPRMQQFVVASSRVSSGGGYHMCAALSSLHHLHHLNLSDSSLGAQAGLILAKELLIPSKTRHLTYLNLGDIGVNDDSKNELVAMTAIIKSLRRAAPHLQHLDLSSNEINARLAGYLAPALLKKRHLRSLNLECNEIHTIGANRVIEALSIGCSETIETLNLTENGISSRTIPHLVKLLGTAKSMKHLLLNGNRFDEPSMESLREAAQEVELSSLSDNDDDDDEDESDTTEDDADDVISETEHEEDECDESEHKDSTVDQLADELNKVHVA